jgi:hypothetical protein
VHVFDSFGLGNAMRGADRRSEGIFSYVRLEQRVPADHPLRAIRDLVDAALKDLSRDFARLYARHGRRSIPPERLLRALLLQAFYTVRSERQLMEQLNYNLLFRWFVGLSIDDAVWDATNPACCSARRAAWHSRGSTSNRKDSPSSDWRHFLPGWCARRSRAERNFHGEKRKNDTHSSTTDQSRCAPARRAGARAERPVAG